MNLESTRDMCPVKEITAPPAFGISLQKYGEILLSNEGDEFILCCTLCIEIFFEYSHFIKHARIQHNVEVDDSGIQESFINDFDWEQTNKKESNQYEDSTEETIHNAKESILTTETDVDHCEEVICYSSNVNDDEPILETDSIQKNYCNIEYLLDDCLHIDEDIAPSEENENNIVQPEGHAKTENKNYEAHKKDPAANYSMSSLIRKKRLLWYFIELYRDFPCLWRADHEHVGNRDERLAAIEEIAATMHRRFRYQISTSKVIKTIKNIRASYLREWHRKANNSEYTPKLWYYGKLSFIEDAFSYDTQQYHIKDDELLKCIITPSHPKCDNCQREFKTKQAWRQHLRTHSDCKPYKCRQCEKCFRSVENLQAHLTTHAPFEEQCYSCEFCGLEIANKHNYLVHLRRHKRELKMVEYLGE